MSDCRMCDTCGTVFSVLDENARRINIEEPIQVGARREVQTIQRDNVRTLRPEHGPPPPRRRIRDRGRHGRPLMKQPAEEEVNGSIVVEDIGSGMLAGLRYQDQDVIGLRIGGPVLASVLNEIPEITEHRGGSDTRCRS